MVILPGIYLQKKWKKIKKNTKKTEWAIDTFWSEVYILYHRRNTELRLNKRIKKFFDKSGKEITD